MKYIFQESKIWEAGNPVDPNGKRVTIKMPKADEKKARRKLPPTDLGRQWVLVEVIDNNGVSRAMTPQ